jgi:hypothetical protein
VRICIEVEFFFGLFGASLFELGPLKRARCIDHISVLEFDETEETWSSFSV